MTFLRRIFDRSPSTPTAPTVDAQHREAIARTANMCTAGGPIALAKRHGLDLVNLTWEDTARYAGSSVGPNISDMTIQVAHREGGETQVTCMPVIRHPNFSDKTADVSIDDVKLRVGNEAGAPLETVSLRTYLRDLRRYLSKPSSWAGQETSLLAPREKEVLVSAQACFLPVPKSGKAEFNPVLFNYQSAPGSPAVLAIVATREGTSATIIDNERDGFGAGARWGQRLFFNQDGERASFTGTRLAEFAAAGGDAVDRVSSVEEARAAGLNCVLVIQVPLVQPRRERSFAAGEKVSCLSAYDDGDMCAGAGVDEAVIGHGEVEGPFTEIDGLAIRRDARYPIRVTVQLYKATSDGVVEASDMKAIAAQLEEIYADAKAIGSLVLEPDAPRSTAWDDEGKGKVEPAGWWKMFWATQASATGKSRAQLQRELERLLGRSVADDELDAAIRRVFKAP